MRRLYLFVTVACLVICGCTNLDENIYSNVDIDHFFKNEKELIANAGRAYTKLQGYNTEQSLWTLLLQASDECAVPASGGEWYSNGRYEEVQTNNIPATNKLVKNGWKWVFNGIAACNEIIYETELSKVEFSAKDKILSEMRVLRCFYYYEAMATWGNVPFTEDYTETGYPQQKSRKEIYDIIEKEIKDNISNLDAEPSTENYGRVTQAFAYTLLAKMYLNSEAWFGNARWDEAAYACKHIIDSGNYKIEDDYDANFNIINGNSKENIFAIVYDRTYTQGYSNAFYLHTLTLEAESESTFNLHAGPWAGFVCQPDFFQTYDSKDKRLSQSWLYGEQYDINGKDLGFAYNPVFDESRYYNKNGGRGHFDGARCRKWAPQTDGSITNYEISQDNDFAIFRYADVVLMYVEALVRQGKVEEAVSMPDFQKIRKRAGLDPYTSSELTLTELYNERGRELAWEGWCHEDMIRFGTYLKKSWAHPDQTGQDFRNLMPIPADVLNANPNLKQNEGY
ncbi:hypothetical protein PRBRB14_15320 [Hallella multisaccharivorax DSM 17128]|uniref:RagB/SusD domain-containing protein n=1 Tax=Hallella multisaccharivorax DSM 17128 TaxID=688246 RepID=F8NC98_9BACT|nr:RagB/SusD family nutrient uptake outer membrane protein [Hallella multisaccharivorax]EGN58069.1 RagB/SusD domain-containing protein [Hallella multisaccharivorax DSM 17128]GJG30653.1 hypothetical protein PRBRB14_15320 [Hallella multisaccharivorax DSM 17128]